MSDELCVDKARWIQNWLKSTEVSATLSTLQRCEPPYQPDDSRPARCSRRQKAADTSFTTPYNAPHTSHSTGVSDTSRGKRNATGMDQDDDDLSPKSRKSIPFRRLSAVKTSQPRRRPPSPSQLKSSSKSYLELLEKPVHSKLLVDQLLPPDAKTLASALEPIDSREGIIPHEVREQVSASLGTKARPFYFRPSTTTTPQAPATHDALCEILREARQATDLEYHECAWNHLVHTPLLKLVCTTAKPREHQQPQPQHQEPQHSTPHHPELADARLVPVMLNHILRPYIPAVMCGHAQITTSASESGSIMLSRSISELTDDTGSGVPATQSRSDSEKVDYAIAVDVPDNAPLGLVFRTFVLDECVRTGLLPHVNQTVYRPLQWSPIACSIETKLENGGPDPLMQLGIWIASWHKRMHSARQYILSEVPGLSRARERLPSALLIQVVGHAWRLFIACETADVTGRGESIDSITAYGPIPIGSTIGLVELYQLVAALQVIKAWSETTFCLSLEQWFLCDELTGAGII